VQAVAGVAHDYATRGLGALMDTLAIRDRLRARLAGLISVDPSAVGMCPSTTRGITDIALAINWQPGDRIIVFTGEFPANVTPWQQVARTFDLELVFVSLEGFARSPQEGLAALEQVLPGTRLVAVSLVQFQTGLRMPVGEMAALCHRFGAEILVDAVQGLGVVAFDATATGIDYLSCGSHKWLMGLEGLGFVYIRPNRIHGLSPGTAGWLSHEDPLGFLLNGIPGELRYDRPIRNGADFTEGGALNLLGIAALDAAVDCIQQIGVSAINRHVQAYLSALEPELVNRGFTSLRTSWAGGRSGSLSVELPKGVDLLELNAALAGAGIACSTPDGKLRFAPHWPNCCERELPAILAALDGFLGASLFAAAHPLEDELDDAFEFADAGIDPANEVSEPASAQLPPNLAQKLGLPGTSLPAEFIVAPTEIGPHQAAWNLPSRAPEFFLDRVRHALAHAILAPSIRNTQPWRWQLSAGPGHATVALFEQPNTLPRTDPEGRFARISLGAALACLDLACENLGLLSAPISGPVHAVACRRISTGDVPIPAGERHWMFQSIPKRRTHRGVLAARPPNARLLERLTALAKIAGCGLHIIEGSSRTMVAATVAEALARQHVDLGFQAEAETWTRSAAEPQATGIPEHPGGESFVHDPGDGHPRPAHTRDEILAGAPVLAILTTPGDDPIDWLTAGRGLLYTQLRGRVDHLWMSPLNAPLTHAGLRRRLHAIVGAQPQLVLRMGHGGDTARTPRRNLDEVLSVVEDA